jgi:hypothetical protein
MRSPANHDAFARELRLIARLDIKEAHDLARYIDQHPDIVVLAGVEAEVADYIADTLRACGAQIDVEMSSIHHPMVCTPDANVIYEWGGLSTLKPRRENRTTS